MYPIPRHLTRIFQVNVVETTEYDLKGTIRCDCGCRQFRIKTVSNIDQKGNLHLTKCKQNNSLQNYALAIVGTCKSCGRDWLIFDMSKHGFSGYICHDGVALSITELKAYHCPKCGKNSFYIEVEIEVEDKEQFVEDIVGEGFVEEDYVDAFNWIVISIKCSCCGNVFENWVNLELS